VDKIDKIVLNVWKSIERWICLANVSTWAEFAPHGLHSIFHHRVEGTLRDTRVGGSTVSLKSIYVLEALKV
jgi:hypothetical protein